MKVIKRGKNKQERSPLLTKKITCGECGCQFRLESEAEARLVPDSRDGNYYVIACPECKQTGTYQAGLFRRSSVA